MSKIDVVHLWINPSISFITKYWWKITLVRFISDCFANFLKNIRQNLFLYNKKAGEIKRNDN
jgi:hypothetical protein